MSDLNAKLAALEAQLGEARAELEAAQCKAAETADLHEKLKHTTRARAAQDLISSLEAELSITRAALAQAEREQHRAHLLEQARRLGESIVLVRERLEGLLAEAEDALIRLIGEAPSLLREWQKHRHTWRELTYQILGFSRPLHGGHVEAMQQQQAYQNLLRELAEPGEVLRLEPANDPAPGERQWRPARNWDYGRPASAEDLVSFALDKLIRR